MKKIALLSFLFAVSFMANAEQQVGEFANTYFQKTFKLEAFEENNKLKAVYIEVVAEDSKNALIVLKGENLESFKTALELCRDKFIEWSNIAKQNNITEMKKSFDIKFPTVDIGWYGSKWWFSLKKKPDFKFLILDSGKMLALWTPKVTASSNRYIDERIYFVFESVEDFNSLISQLNGQRILNELLKTKNDAELFK